MCPPFLWAWERAILQRPVRVVCPLFLGWYVSLSLGERAGVRFLSLFEPRLGQQCLPLPWGEGRGEGGCQSLAL